MSCYEWERGTLKVPAKDWPELKKQLRARWNQIWLQQLETALELHATLKAAARGKRQFNYREAVAQWLQERARNPYPAYAQGMRVPESNGPSLELAEAAAELLFPAGATKPVLPKKKNLPLATRETLSFQGQHGFYFDASITLDDEHRTLTWSVPDNNHAIDRARENPLARTLFAILGQIDWTRGSGGKFVGNNEYNGHDAEEGGGANYVTARYGPLGRT